MSQKNKLPRPKDRGILSLAINSVNRENLLHPRNKYRGFKQGSNKIAFFNYLPLEYGGGTTKYFIETSIELKKRYPKFDFSIITFNEKISNILLSLYSIYFSRNIRKDFLHKTDKKLINLKTLGIRYIKATGITNLKNILSEQSVVYCKNDILETSILKLLVGYNNLNKVIIGFHTPIKYENTTLFHSKLHNIIYNSFFYRLLIKNATKFHVLNSNDFQILKNIFPTKIIKQIPNPFAFNEYFIKAKINKYKLNLPTNKLKILWVGRLNREKGADDLIEIIKSVNSDQNNSVFWTIVGVGEYHNKFESLVKISNNIKLLGYVENRYLPSIYMRCDIFLSTSKFETFPYTFLEAQSFGLPIISFNIHGCNEIIKNGLNGLLVQSSKEMTEIIRDLSIDNTFNKMKICKYIRHKYNNENIIKHLHTLLTTFN